MYSCVKRVKGSCKVRRVVTFQFERFMCLSLTFPAS